MMKFGEKLSFLRKQRDMTQQELAERLGEYAGALLETLEDADRANPALEVLYEK